MTDLNKNSGGWASVQFRCGFVLRWELVVQLNY